MQSSTIRFQSSSIHFTYFGSGNKVILCFHGYGENSNSFVFLSKHLNLEIYTLIAIDLPYHGKTQWQEGLNFSITAFLQIIRDILSKTMPSTINYKLILMGYSMGGRAALHLYQLIPEQVEKIVLLAPDGLKINFWYWLATQSRLGNKFFGFTMKHPNWFFGFLKLMNKLRLVNTSIFKYVDYYIGDEKVRTLLYQRWTTLRKLKPDLALVKSHIKKNDTLIKLIYGKHDRIILSSVGEKFKAGIEKQCSISVMEAGHQVLNEKYITEILAALLSKPNQ